MFSIKSVETIASGRPVVGISWSGGFWAPKKERRALELKIGYIFEKGALCKPAIR